MKKWHTIVLALAIAALIGAASFLYNTLKDAAAPDRLAAVPQPQQTEPSVPETTAPETAAPADTTEPQTDPEPTEEPDMTAPDFTVYDGAGDPVTLESLRGKPVILNFWATWCGYCVMEMPEFQSAFDTYGEEIHFMMINVTDGYQETREAAEAFLEDKGYTFPVYYDLELSAANAYGTNALPITFFIDAQGRLVAYGSGALDEASILQGIGMVLEN